MNIKWKKRLTPLAVFGFGVVCMLAIAETGKKDGEQERVDTRPTVNVESVSAQDYQVVITSFGEVEPLERTQLSAQVSGEVMSWHPDFVPGGLIKRGETLFSIEKDTYEAALWQAEAELSRAKAALIEEQARANVAKEEAKLLDSSRVTDLYLRKPQVLSAQAAVKSAEAAVKIAKRDLDNCDVKAPFDALVVSKSIGVGQFVAMGSQIAVLNNVEAAEITIPIAGFDTTFLPDEITGQTAQVTSRGIKTVTREGRVLRDLGIVDSATRMGQLVVRVEDPYGFKSGLDKLKFGSYAEVSFVGKTLENVFRLPQELVTNQTVWVVDEEQKLMPKTVAVLREEGEFFLISDGLQNQDKLVTTVPEYPQKGMEVKVAGSSNITAANSL